MVSLNLQKQYWSWSYFYVSPASLLKHLKHANIVLLHDIIQTKETLTFVLEHMVSYSFFWLPVKLEKYWEDQWLHNEFAALWDIGKETNCNPLV